MARRRLGFKPTLRQLQQQSIAAQKFLALGAPEEKRELALAHIAKQEALIKPVHERAKPVQREAPVVQAISELLAVHPRVLFAVRQNSGMASYEAKSGRYAPVFFYRILTKQDMTITDFWGILDPRENYLGRTRVFAIEAKAPGWTKPRDDRERKQAAFLQMVRDAGGIGIFATDVSHVAEALK